MATRAVPLALAIGLTITAYQPAFAQSSESDDFYPLAVNVETLPARKSLTATGAQLEELVARALQ
ncbi:MAG: hypothetical protein AB7Q45_24485, partial [Planctomycetaceae bacterium]